MAKAMHVAAPAETRPGRVAGAPRVPPPPSMRSGKLGFEYRPSGSTCQVSSQLTGYSSTIPSRFNSKGRGMKSKTRTCFSGFWNSEFPRRLLLVCCLLSGLTYLKPVARPLFSGSGVDGELEQVHISLWGQNHMKVTWITSSSSAISTVEYGISAGNYGTSVSGTKGMYSFLTYQSGTVHSAVIGPLDSDTTYHYRCSRMGKDYSFKTLPSKMPVTLAVVGDIGQTKWTMSTLDHVQKSDYDMLLFAGDLSYADYYQPRWDSFGRLVEPLASSRPWMVTEGNHEKETLPLIVAPFKAYNTRWRMPFELSGSTSNLYYSFEVAGAHIVMLGSYADFEQSSRQFRWLQADLAKVDREKTPWLLVVLHAPWYNSNSAHRGEGDRMLKVIEPLLHAARADILFAGHVHAYERWARMYRGKEDASGMIHITIGDGGNREGLAKKFLDPRPAASRFREASFGHGKLRLVNSTHAHWTWHRNDDSPAVAGDEKWFTSHSSTQELRNGRR